MIKKTPLNLIGNIEVVSKAKNKRIVAGYANVALVDSQNQFIPLETLKAGLETLLKDESYANLMLSHNNVQIGKILKSYGKLTTHVDDKGLYIIAELRQDTETANETWESILKGEMNGFSIGCEVLSEPREVCNGNGFCVTYLDKINILEVSVCSHPVSKLSGFVIISKSDSKGIDVCKSCNIIHESMTEEKVEEQKVETKEEPKELSVEERIEAMERSIFNIQAAITKMSELQMAELEKAKMPEEKKPEEKVPEEEEKKPAEAPCKAEEIPKVEVDVNTLTKKDFDDFKKSIEESISKALASITESLKPKEQETKIKSEMELSMKAKDEQIKNMKKQLDEFTKKDQIKTIEKAAENSEPKTVQDNTPKEKQLSEEEDCPIVVSNGQVTHRRFVKG